MIYSALTIDAFARERETHEHDIQLNEQV